MPSRRNASDELEDDDNPPLRPAGIAISSQTTNQQPDSDDDGSLENLRQILAGGAEDRYSVKIYKHERGMMPSYCRDYAPSELLDGNFEAIRREWGPGQYEARIYGSKGFHSRPKFNIAAPISSGAVAVVPPAPSNDASIAALVNAMQEQNRQIIEAINHRPAAPDPMVQMQQMMTLATMMRSAFGIDNKPAQAVDPLAQMTQLIEVMRGTKTAIKELREDDDDKDNGEESLTGIIKSVAPIIQSALSGGQQAPQLPAPAGFPMLPPMEIPPSIAHAGARDVSPNPAPETGTPEMQPNNLGQLLLLGIIEDLCDMAKLGKSAKDDGAQYALDKLPDDVLTMLENRYWWQALSTQFPVVAPYQAWLYEVRAEVLRAMNEPEEPEQPGEAKPG